jgi:hypothetical protein
MYDMWGPDTFGGMTASAGYWFNAETSGTLSYWAYPADGLDRWISVYPCGGGYSALIGMPFTGNTAWENWKATDGVSTKTLYDASQYGAGWLQSTGVWWDETTQSLVDFGLPDDWPTTNILQSWHGYWITAYQKLGLIAPAPSP